MVQQFFQQNPSQPQAGQPGVQTPVQAQPPSGYGAAPVNTPAPNGGFVQHGVPQAPQQVPQQPQLPNQQPQQPQIDAAEYARLRQDNDNFQRAFGELSQRAQAAQEMTAQQQVKKQYDDRISNAVQAARNMGSDQGQEYLATEARNAMNDLFAAQQAEAASSRQRMQASGLQMAKNQYAADIVRDNGFTPEQHAVLQNLPDMQSIHVTALSMLQSNQQMQALQAQINQGQLSQQATQLGYQAAGMGAGMGAQQPISMPDLATMDKDARAMAVYRLNKQGITPPTYK